jgi:hypothetical protein
MEHDRVEHYRKSVTAGAMILGPVALLAADSIWPTHGSTVKDWLGQFESAPTRGLVSAMMGVVGVLLMIGAITGVAHMLHERSPGTAVLGGALTIVGLVSIIVLVSMSGTVMYEMTRAGHDRAQMTSLLDDLASGALVPFYVGTVFATVGAIILGVGLLRAKVVAAWSAWAFMAGALVSQVANPMGMKPLIVLADVLFVVGLGSIGWTVLSETDEEWVHTPVFHGMGRPVAH